ncbi:DEKNAAC103433 [Brettanomyces naardenensis]|uniref:DEKNAAC103433 n=1 Tax=Brettanomyces naardenensis TaxID=13370 RepID=A0A448YNE8_BRENA|nr:DEKNAAC103433 [Brettanomyces naardenensis]
MSLRVGYIPEHFSTPIAFATKYHFFEANGLKVKLIPFPSGSGHLITSLKNDEIDIAIGLTEAFVRGLCQGDGSYYKISGEYVESPLCWAVSTGKGRGDVTKVSDLKTKNRIGISRVGSGSYVMAYVLALEQGFKENAFEFKPLDNFKRLRDSVNDSTSDAFMWEYFTTKKYYDNGELKKIGEIYTPWSSWVITTSIKPEVQKLVPSFLESIQQGIDYYNGHEEEAIDYILENLDYNSRDDLKEWAKRVKFAKDVSKVHYEQNVEKTKEVLKTAGLISD